MKLDIDLLIAYFGGVNALAEALRRHDPEGAASTAAIYKWRTRGSLPLAQLQRLTALAAAPGRPGGGLACRRMGAACGVSARVGVLVIGCHLVPPHRG